MANIKDLEKFAHELAHRVTDRRNLDGADRITDPRAPDYQKAIAASLERDAPEQKVSSPEGSQLASQTRVTER